MHLRVTDPDIDEEDRDRRVRTWYSLYSLEIFVAEVTGRPTLLFLTDVSLTSGPFHVLKSTMTSPSSGSGSPTVSREIWLDFLNRSRDIPQRMTSGVIPWKSFAAVGQKASPLHFPQILLLCRLRNKIAAQLYSGTLEDSWAKVQHKISELQTELRHWAEDLPDDLAIQSKAPTEFDPRNKIELSMYYYSVQMILHRRCLCEIIIEKESLQSQEFNRSGARACVHAAMSMLAVIPHIPSAHEAYQLLPFWAFLHYVAQATAVLLLELSLDGRHFPTETTEVVNSLRKAMAYLWRMTKTSLSAYRAWRIFRRLLSAVSERYEDLDVADIPEAAPKPPGWDEEDEESVTSTFTK
jgi:hypothetical protein